MIDFFKIEFDFALTHFFALKFDEFLSRFEVFYDEVACAIELALFVVFEYQVKYSTDAIFKVFIDLFFIG